MKLHKLIYLILLSTNYQVLGQKNRLNQYFINPELVSPTSILGTNHFNYQKYVGTGFGSALNGNISFLTYDDAFKSSNKAFYINAIRDTSYNELSCGLMFSNYISRLGKRLYGSHKRASIFYTSPNFLYADGKFSVNQSFSFSNRNNLWLPKSDTAKVRDIDFHLSGINVWSQKRIFYGGIEKRFYSYKHYFKAKSDSISSKRYFINEIRLNANGFLENDNAFLDLGFGMNLGRWIFLNYYYRTNGLNTFKFEINRCMGGLNTGGTHYLGPKLSALYHFFGDYKYFGISLSYSDFGHFIVLKRKHQGRIKHN
jgi:hypothetical protein